MAFILATDSGYVSNVRMPAAGPRVVETSPILAHVSPNWQAASSLHAVVAALGPECYVHGVTQERYNPDAFDDGFDIEDWARAFAPDFA